MRPKEVKVIKPVKNSEGLAPCKKCGSYPTLYHPPEPHGMGINSLYGLVRPDPYYRCEMCIAIEKAEGKKRLVDRWNRSQE